MTNEKILVGGGRSVVVELPWLHTHTHRPEPWATNTHHKPEMEIWCEKQEKKGVEKGKKRGKDSDGSVLDLRGSISKIAFGN